MAMVLASGGISFSSMLKSPSVKPAQVKPFQIQKGIEQPGVVAIEEDPHQELRLPQENRGGHDRFVAETVESNTQRNQ